jgi:tartrate-resistant acid phosphatase type 5
MSFLYKTTSNLTASLNSGSYLNKTDYNLFFKQQSVDVWYGLSSKDSIEFSVYDLNKELLYWNSTSDIGSYKENTLTYWDDKNNVVQYPYEQFVFQHPLYKNEKILISPMDQFLSSSLPTGKYIFSYQFTRYLAGTPNDPLVIKEISPSKTELKLIPSKGRTLEYDSFCINKIPVYNVSPLYIKLVGNCPYDQIYKSSQAKYKSEIELVKSIFFLENDGKVVEFLKTIYEDYLKYFNQIEDRVESFVRIQGIRSYFNNFLVSNLNESLSFDEIEDKFEEFVNSRLDILFINFTADIYQPARRYLFNLFADEFFKPLHTSLKDSFNSKYKNPLKNALCYGDGNYIPILTTAFLDERINDGDPLTLLAKLQSPLNDDLSIKSSVWVTNLAMVPTLFNCIIKDTLVGKTIKISPADFTIIPKNVSFSNQNLYFTNEDLTKESVNEELIQINKKINELNIDYTSFENFTVFSSAELRHNIFKNKMISFAGISSSLSSLETSYSSSGYSYPYYTSERESLLTQQSDVLHSLDGFESYLYKTKNYIYNPTTKTFSSSSFVSDLDEKALTYDKYNRDSLVNNTPQHIVSDSENDDYLIFLSMIGHYFDNLYVYIKSVPSEQTTNTDFSKNILQTMLQTLGWKLDASIEQLNISENYLDINSSGTNKISAENRTRIIWNRILNTLPLIYKTKGTEECIKLILSCYGIPSTLISIREYGGTDYVNSDKTTYTIDEKIFMLTFKGYREYLSIPFTSNLQTIEFKTSLDSNREYIPYSRIPLAVKYNQYNQVDWTVGVYKEPDKHLGRAYFELNYPSYKIGIVGSYGIIDSTYSQSLRVAQSIATANPDIIVTTGDNTYETGPNAYDNTAGRLYHQFMNPYNGVSGSASTVNRFFPSIGNNDYISGYSQYNSFFSTTPRFYTFKQGNVQLFVLNSDLNEPSGSNATSTQATWFKQQVSSSRNDVEVLWRVAVFHHDYISSGNPVDLGTWMDWPWAAWSMDLVLMGSDRFYERLEDDIPVIIQGAGGNSLYSFSTPVAESKFRWNDSHGYSILTARGNKLTVTAYDMFGNQILDTGSVTLPSCSIENGSLIIQKQTYPFSDKSLKQEDVYLLTDPIPIFNGEIFNVMVRKNNPDGLFEYNSTADLIPTKYDFKVQRKDDSRTIFSSSKFDYLTKTYNIRFSNEGTLYFGNYENSSSFKGLLDKILIWDSPITDNTFDDHSNNINSYSFTGSSIPYQTLYFRMNFDYPQDLSSSNRVVINNSNTYYSSSIYAYAYNFGVVNYSSSIDNCLGVSHSYYPYQFTEIPYNQTFTMTSYGPNKFKNQKIKKTELELAARLDPMDRSTESPNKFDSFDSNQIGLFADPNDYKNKDIFRYLGDYGVIELVADPADMFSDKYSSLKTVRESYNRSGNKRVLYNEMFTLYKFYFDKSIFETIKQLIPARNNVLSGILIEPTVLERPKYQYKRLGSEACSVEFTSSMVPATLSSSFNFKPPTLSMNNVISSGGRIRGDLISAEFRSSKTVYSSPSYEHVPFYLPTGPYLDSDPLYQQFKNLKDKLVYVSDGWIKKYPDVGELNGVEQHSDWSKPIPNTFPFSNLIGFSPTTPIQFGLNPFGATPAFDGFYPSGSGYYYLKNCFFYVKTGDVIKSNVDLFNSNLFSSVNLSDIRASTRDYPPFENFGIVSDISNPEELGVHCDDTGKIIETVFSGSQSRYLIKQWKRHDTFVKDGEYQKPQPVTSQSVYLYNFQTWNEGFYSDVVYTASVNITVSFNEIDQTAPYVSDYSPNLFVSEHGWTFHHGYRTFKKRPNSTKNNTFSTFSRFFPGTVNLYEINGDHYFETMCGYPRNHLTHKKLIFSKEAKTALNLRDLHSTSSLFSRYTKSRQTIDTTVDASGLEDNSLPIQSVNVSNINVVKNENVLQ